MDKLVGVLVVCGLVLIIFLGVFQGTLGGDIQNQGTEIGQSLDSMSPSDASKVGTDTNN